MNSSHHFPEDMSHLSSRGRESVNTEDLVQLFDNWDVKGQEKRETLAKMYCDWSIYSAIIIKVVIIVIIVRIRCWLQCRPVKKQPHSSPAEPSMFRRRNGNITNGKITGEKVNRCLDPKMSTTSSPKSEVLNLVQWKHISYISSQMTLPTLHYSTWNLAADQRRTVHTCQYLDFLSCLRIRSTFIVGLLS